MKDVSENNSDYIGVLLAQIFFMDVHARPHRAYVVTEYLQTEDMARMDWPPYSLIMNWIEHVWAALGPTFSPPNPPLTPQKLKRTLLEEWRANNTNDLVKSMKTTCELWTLGILT